MHLSSRVARRVASTACRVVACRVHGYELRVHVLDLVLQLYYSCSMDTGSTVLVVILNFVFGLGPYSRTIDS